MIDLYDILEAANEGLRQKIETLEKELQGKTKTEKSYLEERDLIRSKIDSLLIRLEEIAVVLLLSYFFVKEVWNYFFPHV